MGISSEALQLFESYHWPGNVRELENVLERAIILCNRRVLKKEHFSIPLPVSPKIPLLQEQVNTNTLSQENQIVSLEEMERFHLEHVLRLTNGNIARAARELKIGRSTLYRKLQKYHIADFERNAAY